MIVTADDIRDRLEAFLDEQGDENLRSLVEAVFTASKDTWVSVVCKDCGKAQKVPAPVPDVVARAKALDLLVNQAKGKPAQTVRHEHSGMVGLRAVSSMSSSEIEGELASLRARRALPQGPPEAA